MLRCKKNELEKKSTNRSLRNTEISGKTLLEQAQFKNLNIEM